MNKKITIGIITIAVILFAGWMILGVGNRNGKGSKSSEASASKNTDAAWEKIKETCGYASIVEQSKEIKQDDWSYQINEVEWTKKQGNWPYPDKCWYQCDKEGNVLGDVTLLKVNITITRYKETGDWNEDLYLNTNYLNLFDESGKAIFTEYEVVSATDVDMERKDCFKSSLKTGESMTTDLVYVVEDKAKEQTKYAFLSINNTGKSNDDLKQDEHCYIKLNIGE
ncbi:MAG: hypothetical protein ACI4C5_07395 [Lachnospiraceae bacterium]